jgi:hypothetical protein
MLQTARKYDYNGIALKTEEKKRFSSVGHLRFSIAIRAKDLARSATSYIIPTTNSRPRIFTSASSDVQRVTELIKSWDEM